MTTWMWVPLGKKITENVAGYSVLENHRVHPPFLPQVLLRASEAAGMEATNPAPAKRALSSPLPCAAETWLCHLTNVEAIQGSD